MAKSNRKSSGRRGGRRISESDNEDGAMSYAGSSVADDTQEKEEGPGGRSKARAFDLEDWDLNVDRIYSARPGKRILFLKWLHQALLTEYLPEQVQASRDTLISSLISSIDKGGVDESELACACLSAVLLNLGQDELSSVDYERIRDSLKRAALKGRSGSVRSRAALCFGILAFMGCNDDVYLNEANAWFLTTCTEIDFDDVLPENAEPDSGLFNGAPASAEVSIDEAFSMSLQQAEGLLYGWTLLASQWRASTLADWDESPTSELLEFSCRCIGRESPRLRIVAGFALALLLESKWKVADTERDPEAAAAVSGELESRYAEVIDSMRDLGSGKEKNFERGLSRDERKNQKTLFRMFVRTAENGDGPSETMCLGSRARTTSFKSWVAYLRYDVFKRILKEALASHMISNPAVINCVNVFDKRHSSIAFTHTTEIDMTAHSVHDIRERSGYHRGRKVGRDLDRRAKESYRHADDY